MSDASRATSLGREEPLAVPDPGRAGRTPRVVSSQVLSRHGAAVIVEGDLDLATSPQLFAEVTNLIAAGHRHFVVDLSAATFMDSTGIGALLMAVRRLQDDPDAAVVLAGASRVVRRTLDVSGIGSMFSLFASREAAVARLHDAGLRDTWRDVRPRSDA